MPDLWRQLRQHTGFDAAAAARVRAAAPLIRSQIPRVVARFHAEIDGIREARAVFADDAQFDRHHRNLAEWLEELVSGTFDRAYFEGRTRVGRAHNLAGLPQRFMFGAMAVVRAGVADILAQAAVPDALATLEAFDRLLDLELAFMLETYAEERLRAERSAARAASFEEALTLETRLRIVEDHVNRLVADESALGAIVHALVDATGCEVVAVHRLDAASGTFALIAQHCVDVASRSLVIDVVLEGDPARRLLAGETIVWSVGHADRPSEALLAYGIDSFTVFPVRSGREVLGSLGFGCRGRSDLGEVQRGILQALADHLGSALKTRVLLAREGDSRRFETLARFSRVLAHEVRNPLNSMSLQAAILRRRIAALPVGDRAALERPLTAFEQETRRLNELVEHYLLIGKSGDLRRERTRLSDLVGNVLEVHEPALAEAEIVVAVNPAHLDLEVDIDFAKIAQVLHNLVRNAIEAMPAGGRIDVRARIIDDHVRLSVRDTGPGVARPAQIFEMFFTTKPLGTGLGLPVAREIVRAHGGDLECIGGKERGAEFIVTLPLARSRDA